LDSEVIGLLQRISLVNDRPVTFWLRVEPVQY
jgi:hypothetical protein